MGITRQQILFCLFVIYRDKTRSNINNKKDYLFANSEAMKMQPKTLFESTPENWPHLLLKYKSELEAMTKGKKKGVLPPGAPTFLKY